MKYKDKVKNDCIRFRVDTDTNNRIEKICKFLEWTKSRLARECMENYLDRAQELLPEFDEEIGIR